MVSAWNCLLCKCPLTLSQKIWSFFLDRMAVVIARLGSSPVSIFPKPFLPNLFVSLLPLTHLCLGTHTKVILRCLAKALIGFAGNSMTNINIVSRLYEATQFVKARIHTTKKVEVLHFKNSFQFISYMKLLLQQ